MQWTDLVTRIKRVAIVAATSAVSVTDSLRIAVISAHTLAESVNA